MIKEIEQRQQALLLTSLSLTLLLGSFIIFPIWILSNSRFTTAPYIALGVISTLFIIYALSRRHHYCAGSALLITMLFIMVATVLFSPIGQTNSRLTALNFLVITVLISSILFSVRATVVVAIASLLLN